MKQKPRRDENTKLKIEKKKANLSLVNDISNLLINKNVKLCEKEEKSKNNKKSISHNDSKPKHKNINENKIKYDPIIFRMIQNRNSKKWKSNIVFCISEFLTFEENLSLRLVCKLFNNGIMNRYDFLKENIVFTTNNKIHEKIRKEYKINNKKKDLTLFSELVEGNDKKKLTKNEKEFNAIIFNKRETGNFSKKQMLINMINNKDFISIKSRVKTGEFSIPHNLNV